MVSVPITNAMLQPANVNYRVPSHAAMTDWAGGAVGNDIDVSSAAATVNSAAPTTVPDFVPRTQAGKLTLGNLTPGTVMATDVGKDYGVFAGQTGRTGTVEPWQPYPNSLTPPGP